MTTSHKIYFDPNQNIFYSQRLPDFQTSTQHFNMTPKTRVGKSAPSHQFYPHIEYLDLIFLDQANYPKLTQAMNTAYGFSYNFKIYLNRAQDTFNNVALFLPTIQLDIINHIKHCAINTGDKDHIKHIMDTKTNLMADIAKDKHT